MNIDQNQLIDSLLTKFAAARTKQSDGFFESLFGPSQAPVVDEKGTILSTRRAAPIGLNPYSNILTAPLAPGGVLREGFSGPVDYIQDPNAPWYDRILDNASDVGTSAMLGHAAGKGLEWRLRKNELNKLTAQGINPNTSLLNAYTTNPTGVLDTLGANNIGTRFMVDGRAAPPPGRMSRVVNHPVMRYGPLGFLSGYGLQNAPVTSTELSTTSPVTATAGTMDRVVPPRATPPSPASPRSMTMAELLFGTAATTNPAANSIDQVNPRMMAGRTPLYDPRADLQARAADPPSLAIDPPTTAAIGIAPGPNIVDPSTNRFINSAKQLWHTATGDNPYLVRLHQSIRQAIGERLKARNYGPKGALIGGGLALADALRRGFSGVGPIIGTAPNGGSPLEKDPGAKARTQDAIDSGIPLTNAYADYAKALDSSR